MCCDVAENAMPQTFPFLNLSLPFAMPFLLFLLSLPFPFACLTLPSVVCQIHDNIIAGSSKYNLFTCTCLESVEPFMVLSI